MPARIRRVIALMGGRDSGASAVEYALLVAAIAAVIVAVLFFFGQTISNVFSSTCKSIATSAPAPTQC